MLAFVPDIAVEPAGLPFAPAWLFVAFLAGLLGLTLRRRLATKRGGKDPAA